MTGVRRWRLVTALLAVALITIPALAALPVWSVNRHAASDTPVAGMTEVPTGPLDRLGGFATNLPIVVMDLGGKEPHVHSVWDHDKGYFVSVDYDPYIYGSFSLIDTTTGVNRLTDPPTVTSGLKVRLRGSSSQTFLKSQYELTLINDKETTNPQDLLGMGASANWVLNLSFIDKSLLRNYVAYTLAGEIMDHTPKTRYCEVFFKDGDTYQYRGLYLVIQPVEVGDSMLPLPPYDAHFAQSAYVLRRDRYDEDAIILNTYGTAHHLTAEYLSIKYPSPNAITDATIDYITNDISAFEEALFASDKQAFLKYRDYIDVDSFVDYFVFNEFLANYDAHTHSIYMYKNVDGKLTLGPVWDFDRAMDNDYPNLLKIDSTAMHDAVWFEQLMRDGEFVREIVDRYAELRAGPLSNDRLDRLIDQTIQYLGPAQARDWNRWNYNSIYDARATITPGSGELPLTRDRLDYAGTVAALKSTLHSHGDWLDEHMDSLYQFSTLQPGHSDSNYAWIGPTLAVLVVVGFFVTVHLVQRKR